MCITTYLQQLVPYEIKNCVYVTAKSGRSTWSNSTCTASPSRTSAPNWIPGSTEAAITAREEKTKLKWENKSIESQKSISASYYPTTFALPGNNGLNYMSKWTEESRAKNHVTGAVMHETYRYAANLDRDTYVKMDENGSKMMIDASFTARAA